MTTLNFTEENNVLSDAKTEGIIYFSPECIFKVLSYTFYEGLSIEDINPGDEGGELYLLNLKTGLIQNYTIWINDVDEDNNNISYYVCLPTKIESEDNDEIEVYLLDELGIVYSENQTNTSYQ